LAGQGQRPCADFATSEATLVRFPIEGSRRQEVLRSRGNGRPARDRLRRPASRNWSTVRHKRRRCLVPVPGHNCGHS